MSSKETMRVFRRSKFQLHLVIPLMLTCFLSGCRKWSLQPAAVVSDEAPEQVVPSRSIPYYG